MSSFGRSACVSSLRPSRSRSDTPRLKGKVEQTIFIGDQVETIVSGEGGQVTVQSLSGAAMPGAGTEVQVVWRVEDTLVFPREAS